MIDFTVLIPVFNTKPDHLIEAVNSVLNQTHPSPHRVVIIDDGSDNPETLSALRKLDNEKVEVFRLKENKGTSYALNFGHECISTEYIAVMGSDDISLPDRFKKQVEYLEKYPQVDVLGGQLMTFWDHDVKRKSIFTSKHSSIPVSGKGWQTNHGTVMYRNQAVKDVGGYDVSLRRCQDIDLFNRMMEKKKVFRNISNIVYLWRRIKKG